jgi:adenylate cyclase
LERRLAAILAADVAGYSRMMEADEAGTLARLKAHLGEFVRPAIAARHGTVVKTTGDGLLAEFPSVVEAVECAVEIQRGMIVRNTGESDGRQIRFRIGVNLGDIILDEGDIFGDGVNVAARLEGLAEPGGICVHRDVRSQVRNRLPLAFEDMGEVEVKNIDRPLRVYRIVLDGNAAPPASARRASKPKRGGLAAVGALAILLLILAAGAAWLWFKPGSSGDAPPSIASLPTDRPTIADDKEQQYFADGLTEALTTRLSELSGLFVLARNAVHGYESRDVSPQDVSRDLGVRYVLDGSVRKAGTRIRISANLVETTNARQIWADQYDRELTDIFAVQDEVIGHIVQELAIKLTNAEEQQIARTPTANLEAYDNYLRAETEGYYKFDYTTVGRALAYYAKAIELDPNFADAYAGYARVTVEVWRLGFDQIMPGPLARKRAYDAAGKALELDPNSARAYTVLAIIQLGDGRHEEAVRSAKQAVALKPSDAEAHANLGLILSYAGDPENALAAVDQALRLNPAAPLGLRLLAGIVFFHARMYDRAIAELEPTARAWPGTETASEMLAASYAMAGQLDNARRELDALPDWPSINLEELERTFRRSYKLDADLKHFISALELAGVPQWPLGFVGRPEDQVKGAELSALGSRQTWTGQTMVRRDADTPFLLQIDDKGRVAYRGVNTLLTGETRIADDRICMRFEGYLQGDWLCGSVFRNATGNGDGRHTEEYVYVLSDSLRYFSLQTQ